MKTEICNNFNHNDFPKPSMISVNNVKLEVFEAGQINAGKPIVLFHGFQKHAFSWRHHVSTMPPDPEMLMINLTRAKKTFGDPIMSDSELSVLISAFKSSGFIGGINWYRNLYRNWHLIADVNPIIEHPALMIYGKKDMIPMFERLPEFAPNVEVVSLDCGHWIQQEIPEETKHTILK